MKQTEVKLFTLVILRGRFLYEEDKLKTVLQMKTNIPDPTKPPLILYLLNTYYVIKCCFLKTFLWAFHTTAPPSQVFLSYYPWVEANFPDLGTLKIERQICNWSCILNTSESLPTFKQFSRLVWGHILLCQFSLFDNFSTAQCFHFSLMFKLKLLIQRIINCDYWRKEGLADSKQGVALRPVHPMHTGLAYHSLGPQHSTKHIVVKC